MDVEEQPQISVTDFRPFSTSEDLHSETASHTHSETASSGYASMHGNVHLGPPEGTHNGIKKRTVTFISIFRSTTTYLCVYCSWY